MKLILSSLLLAIVLMQCTSVENSKVMEPVTYTKTDLIGQWTLASIEHIEAKQSIPTYHKTMEERMKFGPYEDSDPVYLQDGILQINHSDHLYKRYKGLSIEKDSIISLNYPLELGKSNAYTIEIDSLIMEGNYKSSIALSNEKDSLFVAHIDQFGLYVLETYIKTRFDADTLSFLKKYRTNFPLLAGKWRLIREDDYDYGTTYTLNFPFELADTLLVQEEDFDEAFYIDRTYYLHTSGKKLKYFFQFDGKHINLTPDSWYRAYDPYIHYERISEEY